MRPTSWSDRAVHDHDAETMASFMLVEHANDVMFDPAEPKSALNAEAAHGSV